MKWLLAHLLVIALIAVVSVSLLRVIRCISTVDDEAKRVQQAEYYLEQMRRNENDY